MMFVDSTVPSCIPARYALMTGLAPQTSGVVGYAEKKITTPTLPEVLARESLRLAASCRS